MGSKPRKKPTKKPQNKGHTSCLSPEHYTPASHIAAVREVLGEIDLDPGSNPIANRTVKAKRIYTKEDDGTTQPWDGRVFCNAPGDRSGRLVRLFWLRAVEHALDGGVVLWAGFAGAQFFRLGTFVVDGRRIPGPSAWMHVPVHYGPDTTGSGRITWQDGETMEPGKAPGHHNFYCLLGGDAAMRARFRRVFSMFGPVRTPSSLPRKPRPLEALVLEKLAEGPATKSALALAIRCRQGTMCRLVNKLVADGLVERRSYTYHLKETETPC